jgi:lysyl-tRNA synthetase class 2
MALNWIKTQDSSHVESVAYEAETQDLYVEFNDGSMYRYKNVPESVWEELQSHGSKGRYVNIVLRRRFSYDRVS